MPGIALVIEGAVQQAPQPGRHSTMPAGEGGEVAGMGRLSSPVARRRQPA
jgi:hypothetical protein